MQNNAVNLPTLAKLLNLSERRIQQLAREGVIPRVGTGQYDVIGAIRGYLKYIQPDHDDQNSSNYQQQKTRLAGLQADLLELRLARSQGKFIPADIVDSTWADSILRARAVLLGLPPRLSAKISQITDDPKAITRIITQGIEEALDELSKPVTYEDDTLDLSDDDEDARWV